jgi:hypothetical protein
LIAGKSISRLRAVILGVCALPLAAGADETAEALAKKLANPVAALISVPLQFNYDTDIGPAEDGDRYYLNVQPVVPMPLDDDWNLISRTVLPLVSQDDIAPGAGSQSGLGDTVQSLFFSPKGPTAAGWIWGVGPVLLLPTASDELLGQEQWGAGPTAVVLKQQGPWTYGALVNHIESFAGKDARADVSATFLQPFLNFTTPTGRSYVLNTESTYDWEGEEWSVPVNALVTQLLKIGDQRVQIGAGLRYWLDSPTSGPEGIGVRVVVTFLFPQ